MTALAVSAFDETPVFDGFRLPKFDRLKTTAEARTEIWPVAPAAPELRTVVDLATIPASGAFTSLTISSRTIQQPYGPVIVSSTTDRLYVWLSEVASTTSPEDLGVVETIRRLTVRLGVPQAAVFEATGISKRTFHHWKKHPDSTPRAGSLGSFWSLVSATADLETHLAGKSAAVWLRERPERLAAFKAGRFRRLVDQETGALAVDPAALAHRQTPFGDEQADPSSVEQTRTAISSHALDSDETPKVVLD